eukprot:4454476-Amphidinium_carterae.1
MQNITSLSLHLDSHEMLLTSNPEACALSPGQLPAKTHQRKGRRCMLKFILTLQQESRKSWSLFDLTAY